MPGVRIGALRTVRGAAGQRSSNGCSGARPADVPRPDRVDRKARFAAGPRCVRFGCFGQPGRRRPRRRAALWSRGRHAKAVPGGGHVALKVPGIVGQRRLRLAGRVPGAGTDLVISGLQVQRAEPEGPAPAQGAVALESRLRPGPAAVGRDVDAPRLRLGPGPRRCHGAVERHGLDSQPARKVFGVWTHVGRDQLVVCSLLMGASRAVLHRDRAEPLRAANPCPTRRDDPQWEAVLGGERLAVHRVVHQRVGVKRLRHRQ